MYDEDEEPTVFTAAQVDDLVKNTLALMQQMGRVATYYSRINNLPGADCRRGEGAEYVLNEIDDIDLGKQTFKATAKWYVGGGDYDYDSVELPFSMLDADEDAMRAESARKQWERQKAEYDARRKWDEEQKASRERYDKQEYERLKKKFKDK